MSNYQRPTPSTREIMLPDDVFITSKTDLQGRILYCNKVFTDMSGYSKRVLIGSPHNIIRHPDMPRGIFKLLWDTISSRQEFIGYVKNMCADGSFYWVLATVTPDFDESNNLAGYYSARRKPSRKAVSAISRIYADVSKAEATVTGSRQPQAGIDALLKIINNQGKASYEDFVLSL